MSAEEVVKAVVIIEALRWLGGKVGGAIGTEVDRVAAEVRDQQARRAAHEALSVGEEDSR